MKINFLLVAGVVVAAYLAWKKSPAGQAQTLVAQASQPTGIGVALPDIGTQLIAPPAPTLTNTSGSFANLGPGSGDIILDSPDLSFAELQ